MLTGIRDLNYKILNILNDRDLVNFCLVSKEANKIYHDEIFWLNRIIFRYSYIPVKILSESRGKRTWVNYYISDLRKILLKNSYKIFWKGVNKCRNDYILIALNSGIDVNIEKDIIEDNALILINRFSGDARLKTVELLLEKGININHTNKYGKTALMECSKIYFNIVELLLKKDVNPNIQDYNGKTALMYAVENCKTDIVKLLLENGANPNIQDYYGKNVFDYIKIPSHKTKKVKKKLDQKYEIIRSLLTQSYQN